MSLECVKCGGKTMVRDTASIASSIKRRRLCLNKGCGFRFSTIERVIEQRPKREDALRALTRQITREGNEGRNEPRARADTPRIS